MELIFPLHKGRAAFLGKGFRTAKVNRLNGYLLEPDWRDFQEEQKILP
jgi:hypothetical protein